MANEAAPRPDEISEHYFQSGLEPFMTSNNVYVVTYRFWIRRFPTRKFSACFF